MQTTYLTLGSFVPLLHLPEYYLPNLTLINDKLKTSLASINCFLSDEVEKLVAKQDQYNFVATFPLVYPIKSQHKNSFLQLLGGSVSLSLNEKIIILIKLEKRCVSFYSLLEILAKEKRNFFMIYLQNFRN